MSIEETNEIAQADELMHQVRVAHRLLSGYYRRLHASLNRIATDLDLQSDHVYWKPYGFDRPCTSGRSPYTKSPWDFLPGNNTRYLYNQNPVDGKFAFGSIAVDFLVVSDDGILKENIKGRHPYQADGLSLDVSPEQSNSFLRVLVFTPAQKHKSYQRWDCYCNSSTRTELGAAKGEIELNRKTDCFTAYLDFDLSKMMTDAGLNEMCAQIKSCRDQVLASAEEHNAGDPEQTPQQVANG